LNIRRYEKIENIVIEIITKYERYSSILKKGKWLFNFAKEHGCNG